MKDTVVKKRGWVKNVAIIFLAAMLVLTFFSNTIMNRSLPEVAAQYTSSGSITARIRNTGTVVANESYEVKTNQTRTVSEVPVRLNEEVNIGDVLVKLTGSVSEELDTAQNALRELELQLEKELINMSAGSGAVASAARAVQAARNSLADAQRAVANISYSEAAYNAAKAANDQAQAVNNQAQAALAAAAATASARQYDLSIAQAELTALGPAPDLPDSTVDPDIYAEAMQKVNDAQFAFSIAQAAATAAGDAASATASTAGATASEFSTQESNRQAWFSANSVVRSAQLSLEDANANLTLVQSNENISSSIDSIDIRELRRRIEEKRDEIETLQKEGGSSEITSLVSGIIKEINVTPGRDTDPSQPLMVIEVVDRGYSLSFQATAEQANRVNLGDQAEVDRGWWSWGDEITATLVNIRNDPQNPVSSRILTFSIAGDVESGSQLNLTLSQRSENYNVIVPNSALRSDTNGDFVLVVVSRTSPLGNRYTATRVDVTLLASDDTNTAVGGALSAWDFVITYSSAPINPGEQIRLVDNP